MGNNVSCGGCRFYVAENGYGIGPGHCHRFPPKPLVGYVRHDPSLTMFPQVTDTDWCGEFAAIDEDGGETSVEVTV